MQNPVTRPNAVGQQVFTVTSNTPSIDTSMATTYVNVEVNASAVTGTTPSMVIVGQWSYDNGVSWSASDGGGDTWNAISTTGQKMRQHTVKGPLFRLNCTITGTTPSFTFKVNVHLV